MERTIEAYSALSINMIPGWVLAFISCCFLIGSLLIVVRYGFGRGWRYLIMLVLVEYLFLIYGSTVFFRSPLISSDYNFIPFWSYVSAINGEEELLSENLLNVIVFIPIGVLVGLLVNTNKSRVYVSHPQWSWMRALIIGLSLSFGIEMLQFLLQRGFSELDDIIHNTLGFMFGYICVCYIGVSMERRLLGK